MEPASTASTFGFLPVALATGAAFMFGVGTVTTKRGLARIDAHTGSVVSIGSTLVLYLALSPVWMRAGDWLSPGVWVFALNGLIHPMLSLYLAMEATARTGPTVAATFSATAPLFAALTAVAFLGESLNAAIAIGTAATVGGVMLLSWSRGGISGAVRAALLFATGAAVVRGINHTVGKFGLEMLPNAFMAAFVSFGVSFAGSLVVYRLRHRRLPRPALGTGAGWFVATGLLAGAGVLCMYGALAFGRVVTVSPIVAAYPLFALLTALVFREERLSLRLVAGVVVTVGGVALVSAGSAG